MLISSATFNKILGLNNDLISSCPEFIIAREWLLKKVAPETSEKQAFNIIKSQQGLSQLMKAYADDVRSDFISNAEQPLRRTISIKPFRITESLQTISFMRQLHAHYFHFTMYVDIPKSILNQFETSYQSLLSSTLTPAVFTMVVTTYLRSFDLCDRNDIVYDNMRVLKNARSDNLIEKLVMDKFLSDFKKRIEQDHKMKWNASIFSALDAWILNTVLPDSLNLVSIDKDDMLYLLNSCAKEAVVNLRTRELFDIVVDFPSSRPALKDLRQAITTNKQRAAVVSIFQKSCANRLLHGGANTVDILYGYISAIKCFKILDPRGVLLERISKPIRKYLKERDDTISELVSGLLGVSTSNISDLSLEMKSSKAGKDHLLPHANGFNWYPDPIDAPVDFSTDNNFDIVGNLLSMYDSKDAIIKELMKRFAEKMLFPSENLSEDILMKIELLKVQFGERQLSDLDVMAKDIAESKRMNSLIRKGTRDASQLDSNFHMNVISRLFWPKFPTDHVNVPASINKMVQKFSTKYSELKQGRSLVLLSSVGTATIELQLQDRKLEFTVSPDKASAISMFHNHDSWSFNDFSEALHVSHDKARELLSFWEKQGVLKKSDSDVYSALEKASAPLEQDFNNNPRPGSDVDDSKEEMKIYWSYIQGMLTNLGAVNAEKIHSFLKMLVPKETPYVKTLDELKVFLDSMVEEEKLIVKDDGLYKLH